jgi:hypothetical protein
LFPDSTHSIAEITYTLVKWFKLGSDVDLAGGTRVSTVHIDPFLFGIGIGYRFGEHEQVAFG